MTFSTYLGLILNKTLSYQARNVNGRILSATFVLLLGLITFFATTAPENLPGVDPIAEQKEAPEDAAALADARTAITGEMALALADLDPVSIDALTSAFDQLATSDEPMKRNAVRLFAEGKRAEALAVINSIALGQTGSGDLETAFRTLKQLGALAFLVDPAASLAAYQRAKDLNANDPVVLYHLGLLHQQAGGVQAAKSSFAAILAIDRLAGTKWEAAAEGNLGVLAIQKEDFELAQFHVMKSLQYNERLRRPKAIALQHANLGVIGLGTANWTAAERNLTRAAEIFFELEENRNGARAIGNLGLMEQARGDQQKATEHFLRAIEEFRRLEDRDGLAVQLGLLARSTRIIGDLELAEQYYRESISWNESLGRIQMIAAQYASLGGIEYDRQNADAACAYWRDAHDIFIQTDTPEGASQIKALLDQGNCASRDGG